MPAAPGRVAAHHRAIRADAALPPAVPKVRPGPRVRRARNAGAQLPAGHAPPMAAVPRELTVRPALAAGLHLLTVHGGLRRAVSSAGPTTTHAGPAGLLRAVPPVTMYGVRPATDRAGPRRATDPAGPRRATDRAEPRGRQRAAVSAARPGRQRADRVEHLAGTAAARPIVLIGTVLFDARTGLPRATEHAGPTDKTEPQRATGAAGRTVTRTARNAEIHTPLVSDQEAAGLARQTRRATVASDRILLPVLPVQLAGAARTPRRRGRPEAGPGKDRRRAKEGVTAHRGPPVAATAVARKGLLVAATAVGRRNGRLAGGRDRRAVPGCRGLAAR